MKNLLKIFEHICVWFVLLMIPHIFWTVPTTLRIILYEALFFSSAIIVFYLHANLCVPYLLVKKKYMYYLMAIFGLIIFFQFSTYIFSPLHDKYINLIQELYSGSINPPKISRRGPSPILRYMTFFVTIAASGMYSYSIQNAKRERDLRELEKQQIASNVQLLKSQLSPHFLFNALNSIYSLSLKKSDKLPKAILTMSDLLRYVTYESNENHVNIQKEINYIDNYINLQKIRLSTESQILITVKNENEDAEIAPMILIPFVENAFKHGVNSNGVATITLNITINKTCIDFYIENIKYPRNQKDTVHGIGIQNVKTRLELLYDSRYTLDINEIDNKYTVSLKIQL